MILLPARRSSTPVNDHEQAASLKIGQPPTSRPATPITRRERAGNNRIQVPSFLNRPGQEDLSARIRARGAGRLRSCNFGVTPASDWYNPFLGVTKRF